MICLKGSDLEVLLFVHAQPGASRTRIAGLHGNRLKIAVQAPPIEGAANEALTEFLAEALGLPRRSILLKSGATGRQKTFLLAGLTMAGARRKLEELL